ncbi:MAG TPA: ArsR family transcriptional regulator [Thermoplasmata archaeon]|nr:ArsR family transcriptional regulator [Thermoplasmata archaeon]
MSLRRAIPLDREPSRDEVPLADGYKFPLFLAPDVKAGAPGRRDVSELILEFAGSGRLDIVRSLESGPLRFTELSKVLEMSTGEISRNLKRLVASGLLQKDAEGAFELAPLGRGLVAFVPALQTLAARRDYFRDRDLASIPRSLVLRLDELSAARLVTNPFRVADEFDRLISETRTFNYGMCVVGSEGIGPEQEEMYRVQAGRLTEGSSDVKVILRPEELETFGSLARRIASTVAQMVEVRTRPGLPATMMVSDGGAVIGLADSRGRLDMNSGLVGPPGPMTDWCRDLFLHLWERAEPVRLVPAGGPGRSSVVGGLPQTRRGGAR